MRTRTGSEITGPLQKLSPHGTLVAMQLVDSHFIPVLHSLAEVMTKLSFPKDG